MGCGSVLVSFVRLEDFVHMNLVESAIEICASVHILSLGRCW